MTTPSPAASLQAEPILDQLGAQLGAMTVRYEIERWRATAAEQELANTRAELTNALSALAETRAALERAHAREASIDLEPAPQDEGRHAAPTAAQVA